MERAILHCDMNNFYASVECKLDESIKNKPVVVAGEVEMRHGVVVAKNYEANKYGVKVGDTVWQAKNKCKNLVVISPPHFEEYYKFSKITSAIDFTLHLYTSCSLSIVT